MNKTGLEQLVGFKDIFIPIWIFIAENVTELAENDEVLPDFKIAGGNCGPNAKNLQQVSI